MKCYTVKWDEKALITGETLNRVFMDKEDAISDTIYLGAIDTLFRINKDTDNEVYTASYCEGTANFLKDATEELLNDDKIEGQVVITEADMILRP